MRRFNNCFTRHKVMNLFLRTYRDFWISAVKPIVVQLIDDLTIGVLELFY